MSLIRIDDITDDDGDRILVEADDAAVYLTVRPADQPEAEACVALNTPELLSRFADAFDEAREVAAGVRP